MRMAPPWSGRRLAASLALALGVLLHTTKSDFVVESGTLEIELPITGRGRYGMSLANFGDPLYGGTLRGQLVYMRDEQSRYGCGPFQTYFNSTITAEAGIPVIALVDRGGPGGRACQFVQKAYYAQRAGASAVIVDDSLDEGLITMDVGSDDATQHMVKEVTVPAALIQHAAGDAIKAMLNLRIPVIVKMSWKDIEPHTAKRVEWEFWSNSNDECGYKCELQRDFIRDFGPTAEMLEQKGFTRFTPHYITLGCPPEYQTSDFCNAQCINKGRYCEQDPDGDLRSGFSGKDVVEQNLRQLCVFKWADGVGKPWLWWRYAAANGDRCSMAADKYSKECLRQIEADLLVDSAAVDRCVGNTAEDAPNALMEAERAGLLSDGRRGDVSIQPTIIANGVQYRGEIDNGTVLEFLCAGFAAGEAPQICLKGSTMPNDPCSQDNYGWLACRAMHSIDGATRCLPRDTFPFWSCACPEGSALVQGPDGLPKCSINNACLTVAAGIPGCTCPTCVCRNMPDGRPPVCSNVTVDECSLNNGGCWSDLGHTACVNDLSKKKAAALGGADPATVRGHSCVCPSGFEGDGVASCRDIDECARSGGAVCSGTAMVCVNRVGSYECQCDGAFYMDHARKTCIPMPRGGGTPAWAVFMAVFASVGFTAAAGYAAYQWRMKSLMKSEIHRTLQQYMPLGRDGMMDEGEGGAYNPPQSAASQGDVL